MTVYMSWNGATNVTTWSLAGGNSSVLSNPIALGTFPKSGFETQVTVGYASYLFVTALDSAQSVLGNATFFNNEIVEYYVAAAVVAESPPILNTTGSVNTSAPTSSNNTCAGENSQKSQARRNGIPFLVTLIGGAILLVHLL